MLAIEIEIHYNIFFKIKEIKLRNEKKSKTMESLLDNLMPVKSIENQIATYLQPELSE